MGSAHLLDLRRRLLSSTSYRESSRQISLDHRHPTVLDHLQLAAHLTHCRRQKGTPILEVERTRPSRKHGYLRFINKYQSPCVRSKSTIGIFNWERESYDCQVSKKKRSKLLHIDQHRLVCCSFLFNCIRLIFHITRSQMSNICSESWRTNI